MDSIATGDQLEDNLQRQEEEMEILRSMYDKDFQIEDDTPTFSIVVHVGENEGEEATLVVSYNTDYPSKAPPIYQLSVPWLLPRQKETICSELDELYVSHLGELIVYYWVEKLQELLMEMKPESFGPHSTSKLLEPVTSQTNLEGDEGKYSLSEDRGTGRGWTDNPEDVSYSYEDHKKYYDSAHKGKKSARTSHVALPNIFTGEPLTDRKSTFQAHLAHISSVEEVKLILEELYKNKKIASATHNMYAYRIFKEDRPNIPVQDCEDDGETHAGSRLLHLLQILDCRNVVVVVTRWYGGIQLHGDRFKHINNVARILLEKHGYIANKSSTSSSGSKKK